MKQTLTKKVQINIPYRMLKEGYLDKFLEYGLNPEIGFDAGALDVITYSDAENAARQFHRAGRTITLHGPFMDLSVGSPDPDIQGVCRKRFDQLANLVPLFKPRSVVCHTGYDHRRYRHMRDRWTENSLQIWNPLAESLKKAGTRLVLENVYERGPSEILPLMTNLSAHDVGFCLDIGHQAAFSETPLSEWVQSMSSHIRQLHLHDNNGDHDDHLALGSGSIDIQRLFRELHSLSIRPIAVTLEPHREEDLNPSLEYLTTVWPW
ncbi:AP endonuclease, family 2 [delta proteobacterium NaphS2]|nr:AP endonuclease, family 2 [delta proteobacterium NaphS2]